MALEPSLWRTLPEELLHLVFARLPVVGIGQLRVLSKEWKRNIDCKHSAFNRVLDATVRLQKFALMSWPEEEHSKYGETLVDFYDVRDDVQTNKRVFFKTNADYVPFFKTFAADGGLFCRLEWLCNLNANPKWQMQIVVVNPLIQRKKTLPPLLRMRFEKSQHRVKMVQLTVDRKTKEYKLHVVGSLQIGGNNLFAQVYDSQIHGWSVVEPREEGRILGWDHDANQVWKIHLCVYNCADGNLFCFDPSNIAPRFTVDFKCIELLNDHVFVFHQKEPQGSPNLVQDDEHTLRKYCIFEFHLPKKATTWEKLRVHECDPSMYHSPRENYEWSLLSCNGLLLVRMLDVMNTPKYETMWLYNLSTYVWCHLKELITPVPYRMMLSEISWSALS